MDDVYTCNMFMFPVIGAVIGKQKGRNIEIMNSFELKFHNLGLTFLVFYIKNVCCYLTTLTVHMTLSTACRRIAAKTS